MTDYSKLSDEQINTAVAMALGEKAGEPVNGMQLIAVDGEYLSSSFDPCNSWADAGPIIVENCISMVWDCAEDASSAWWNAVDKFDDCRIQYQANPLRAAMIVFLMMNEGE